jgi:hypothetical protein
MLDLRVISFAISGMGFFEAPGTWLSRIATARGASRISATFVSSV